MKRRLRKKLSLGEFTQWGFELIFTLKDYGDDPVLDPVYEDLADILEMMGCSFVGLCGPKAHLIVELYRYHAKHRADIRSNVLAWLQQQSRVTEVWMSEDMNIGYWRRDPSRWNRVAKRPLGLMRSEA